MRTGTWHGATGCGRIAGRSAADRRRPTVSRGVGIRVALPSPWGRQGGCSKRARRSRRPSPLDMGLLPSESLAFFLGIRMTRPAKPGLIGTVRGCAAAPGFSGNGQASLRATRRDPVPRRLGCPTPRTAGAAHSGDPHSRSLGPQSNASPVRSHAQRRAPRRQLDRGAAENVSWALRVRSGLSLRTLPPRVSRETTGFPHSLARSARRVCCVTRMPSSARMRPERPHSSDRAPV
jgi:hypothetical protein